MIHRERSAEELFGAALEISPERRSAFLDEACSSPDLRQLVEQLLKDDERAGSFLGKPLFEYGEGAAPPEASPASSSKPLTDFSVGRFAPGDVIADRFEVVRFIARGGMGEVYEVKDRFLQGANVALKIIRPEMAGEAGNTQRFEQEVILARKVTHPNLCPIYDISRCETPAPPFIFLTMKLLRGETLHARLRQASLAPSDAVEVCKQLMGGVSALHEDDLIHRDIKPSNIMLEQGQAKGRLRVSIMDFGLARLNLMETTIGQSITIAGTLGYMAPELLRGQPPSKATDLFALGIVMHQVLTGVRPVESQSDLSLVPVPALRSSAAPASLLQAVEGFLSANPEKRNRAFEAVTSSESSMTSANVSARFYSVHAKKIWYAGAAGLIVLALVLAAWWTAPPLPRLLRSKQISFTTDQKGRPLLTDGTRLYFQSRGVPAQMSINGGLIAPLPSFGNGMEVRAVSPDGSEVMAIQPDTDEYPLHGQLWLASSLGGAPRRFGSWSAQDARWSPDGKTIAIAAGHHIYMASADGTTSSHLWEAPGTVDSLGFSPDGKELTLAVITKESSREWRIKVDGSDPHPLSFSWAGPGDQWFGQWTPNGKHFVFLTDRDSDGDLFELVSPRWFEFWKKPAAIAINATGLTILGFAPGRDGESSYVLGQLDQGAMQVLDPSSGKYVPFLDGLNTIAFQISPDRKWMAYSEYPTGTLWKSRVDGSDALQLTPGLAAMQSWSPDGKWLVYTDLHKLFIISSDGGVPQELVDPGGDRAEFPTWVPGGKSIAFTHGDYQFRPIGAGIQIVDLATRKITNMPGARDLAYPRWTSDGKFLLATTKDESRIMLYTAKTKSWKELKHFDAPLFHWALAPDNQSVLVRLLGTEDGIYRMHLPDGKWEKVSGTQGITRREGEGWLSVTADGEPAIMTHTSVAQIYSLRWAK